MLAWTKISCDGSILHTSLEYVGSNPTQLANFNNKTKHAYDRRTIYENGRI